MFVFYLKLYQIELQYCTVTSKDYIYHRPSGSYIILGKVKNVIAVSRNRYNMKKVERRNLAEKKALKEQADQKEMEDMVKTIQTWKFYAGRASRHVYIVAETTDTRLPPRNHYN